MCEIIVEVDAAASDRCYVSSITHVSAGHDFCMEIGLADYLPAK